MSERVCVCVCVCLVGRTYYLIDHTYNVCVSLLQTDVSLSSAASSLGNYNTIA